MSDSKDPYAFAGPAEMGEEVPPGPRTYARCAMLDEQGKVIPIGPDPIPLDVWARVVDPVTKAPTGYLKRVRMRSLREVFGDLAKALDVVVCDKCGHQHPAAPTMGRTEHEGCGGSYTDFIDEYLHGPLDHLGDETHVPHDHRWVACYPVTGGSEGHYVHVEFLCQVRGVVPPGQPNVRVVRLALAKTFRGMDHAAEIARRCAVLLGA